MLRKSLIFKASYSNESECMFAQNSDYELSNLMYIFLHILRTTFTSYIVLFKRSNLMKFQKYHIFSNVLTIKNIFGLPALEKNTKFN